MGPKRFVYVLKTPESTSRYYVGLTSNVQQRIAWHIADTVRILPSTV